MKAGLAAAPLMFDVRWRIEINKIDTGIRELAPVAQPFQIVAEIEPVHTVMFIARSTTVPLAS